MNLFNCKKCNYYTDILKYWKSHIKTKKHNNIPKTQSIYKNYNRGNIYKIYFNDIIYIGSTVFTLEKRFKEHLRDYKIYILSEGLKKRISIFPYFKKYGIDNFKIELIKEYNICDRNELYAYEQLYINKIKCINKECAIYYLKWYLAIPFIINKKGEQIYKERLLISQKFDKSFINNYKTLINKKI